MLCMCWRLVWFGFVELVCCGGVGWCVGWWVVGVWGVCVGGGGMGGGRRGRGGFGGGGYSCDKPKAGILPSYVYLALVFHL